MVEQSDNKEALPFNLANWDSKPESFSAVEEDGLYEHHRITVDPGQKIMRVDQYLATNIRNQSRTRIKNACIAGCIRVDEKPVKASYKVKPGDKITIVLPHPPAPDVTPEELPLTIAYEDDDLMLVDKQPGMVVHPGVGHWSGTMVHGLLHYVNRDQLDLPLEELNKPYLVHRIDKDTSGLLIVAKTEYAMVHLSKQFYEKSTTRLYNALVWGDMAKDEGTVVGHVGRSGSDRKRFMVYPDGSKGKHAVTHYKVLERFGFATLVECRLETGRTHQIRVHMKYLNHTLFSDSFYDGDRILASVNTPKYDAFIRNCQQILPRQALHALTLGFEHPASGERMEYRSELPPDFSECLEKMRKYRDTYLMG